MKKRDEEFEKKAEKLEKIVRVGLLITFIVSLILLAISFTSCDKKELEPENMGYVVKFTVTNIDKNTRIEYSRILENNCNYSIDKYEPVNTQDWSLSQNIVKCANPRYFVQITSGTAVINAKVFITSKGNKAVSPRELIYEVNGVKNFVWQK